jgi:hypothetical protein
MMPFSVETLLISFLAIKVQNLIKRADKDIVHPKWLLACVNEGKLLPFEPKYPFDQISM